MKSNSYRGKGFSLNHYPKWTISLSHYNLVKGFFIALSFSSMISTGFFGIPVVSNLFSNKNIDFNYLVFAIFNFLGWVWGFMAYNQFDKFTKLVKNTWSLSHKLDPLIGEYDYKTFNPETNQWEEGYTHFGIIDFWDSENDVPQWLDKAKYWNIFIELQRISKNTLLQVTKDKNLPFNKGKRNLVITLKEDNFNNKMNNPNTKDYNIKKFRVIIPQWFVMNTEYREFNSTFQLETNTIASTIAEINRNTPKIRDEILQIEKTVMTNSWNIIISIFLYLNKSLPLRIIYSKIKDLSPGAKRRRIQYINDNLSRISTNALIEAVLIKAKMVGIDEKSLAKISSLIKFLKNEYDKVGLGEGSTEYHNFHHSLEVAYMSLNMLPKEIHEYIIHKKDYEIMLVAALLHDYNPIYDTKYPKIHSRIPRVTNTLEKIRKMRIHDAYFSFNDEELIKYFRKNGSPLIPTQEFATVHPQHLKNRENNIESKIIEALIWRTDFPFDENSQDKFNQLLKEIKNDKYNCEKINLIAEVLSLADLSVTYLSSDPLLAWNRVIKLYQELDLPIAEAVAGTDRFLSLFSEGSLFKEIINRKNFPVIFKQKWDNVYRFFHEGNPSYRINRTIIDAKTKYQKINMEIDIRNCDFLISNSLLVKNEFFLGIGKDKENIMIARTKLKLLKIENMKVFLGNIEKLLPFIKDESIDNFILNVSNDIKIDSTKVSLIKDIFSSYFKKLTKNGAIQLIIRKNQNYDEIRSLIAKNKFRIKSINTICIPKDTLYDKSIDFDKLENIEIIIIENIS